MTAMTRLALALLLVACGEKKPAPGSATSGSAVKTVETPATSPLGPVDLPVVDGFATPAHDDTTVVVTPTSIVVDGVSVVALKDGQVDPSERGAGPAGLKIPRLTNILAAIQAKHAPASLALAFDKTVPYRTFFEVVFSAKQKEAGFKKFTLLARSPHGTLAEAPFELPDMSAATFDDTVTGGPRSPGGDLAKQIEEAKNAGKPTKVGDAQANDKELAKHDDTPRKDLPARRQPDDDAEAQTYADVLVGEEPSMPARDPRIKLVVALWKTEVLLFSFSGLEGSIQAPKAKIPLDGDLEPLREVLADIVARRWSGKERTERSITIMADPASPMQRVAQVIGAVRADADGKPLFPDVMFSSGFE